jgi:hypothetical protein
LNSPAIAIANGTARDENPVNSTGGWMVIHGSCRSGLRPCPSIGMRPAAKVRNGPRITVTRLSITNGRLRKNIAAPVSACLSRINTSPSVQVISAHRTKVPSCPPQNAA